MRRNKQTVIYLAAFLGLFGIHQFYLGRVKQGLAYFLFCFTLFPMIMGWIDAIHYHNMEQKKFDERFNSFE